MTLRFLVTLSFLAGVAAAQSPPQVLINAPYVTSPPRVVSAILRLAAVNHKDTVYDLGCGDGRVLIAAARQHGAFPAFAMPAPTRARPDSRASCASTSGMSSKPIFATPPW